MIDREDPDRRDFLKKSTGVLTGILAAGSPLAALVPGRVWAAELTSLTSEEGKTLLSMARTIAPHDGLEEAIYALVVAALDAEAKDSPAQLTALRRGVKSLGGTFATAPEDVRVGVLKDIEGTAFFRQVRQATLQGVYSTPVAFKHFGYEGESFSKGGYLLRGFDSLRWLPDVPEADGGPKSSN